uniref:Transmembrane protein 248 n=1 Tax=Salmo trutta TaxID=8032 RepID=A0A673X7B7_SALTR
MNLRSYVNNRLPLVIFTVSISTVAIAFLTIGYFFKIKEIKSPEMTEDWNTFLLRFNEIDFYVLEKETLKHSLNESTTPESMVTSSQDPDPINISVPITLILDPLRPFGGYSRNITHLYATVLGAVNLHIPCNVQQPPHCIPETYTNATSLCKIFDSDTNVYLTLRICLSLQDDHSLINLHLMHTSYFLFVMVITMFCYAVIKGRPGKVRTTTNHDCCPEKVVVG